MGQIASHSKVPTGLLEALQAAKFVAVLTGAGVSAESGIPTFRDALTGLWGRFDPAELATPEAFDRNPEMVTRWYDERRVSCTACRPNAGHEALVRLQQWLTERGRQFVLMTQNVDGLHQRAGNTDVIELHGSLFVWRCVKCKQERQELDGPFSEFPPRCSCGGIRRPTVVLFKEVLPERALTAAKQATCQSDLFLSLGTSGQVQPAAGLFELTRFNGGRSLEINPEQTPISNRVSWRIRGQTGEVLPRLVDACTK